MEGARAGVLFPAVALQAGLVVVRAPGTDVVALTAGTLEWAVCPPQRMDISLTSIGAEEVVHAHSAPLGWRSTYFSRGHFAHAQLPPTVVCWHRIRGDTPNTCTSGVWYGARAPA